MGFVITHVEDTVGYVRILHSSCLACRFADDSNLGHDVSQVPLSSLFRLESVPWGHPLHHVLGFWGLHDLLLRGPGRMETVVRSATMTHGMSPMARLGDLPLGGPFSSFFSSTE